MSDTLSFVAFLVCWWEAGDIRDISGWCLTEIQANWPEFLQSNLKIYIRQGHCITGAHKNDKNTLIILTSIMLVIVIGERLYQTKIQKLNSMSVLS